jgi:hydroxymethylglutaryl-CoA synthase
MMKPLRDVGLVGYGAYVPRYRISAEEISRVWKMGEDNLHLEEKAVPGLDEDTTTIAIEAARNALRKAALDPSKLSAVWLGSESKPYSVKPTATIVAEAVGATPHTLAADWEFACKAGTEAMQAAIGFVGSGMADYAMAIGADTAQGKPGDQLEYTAGAGGAAFVVGPKDESMAYLEGSHSYVTDTPDFFRRPNQHYPTHGNRFTGEPSYFTHTIMAARALMDELGYGPEDYDRVVFHQPNSKFPVRVAKRLGFVEEQYRDGLLVAYVGNTYAASSGIGLAAVLDKAEPGERILLASYGSGAGSDAFSFVTTECIARGRNPIPQISDYVSRRREIDYAQYARHRGKLVMY